MAGRGTPRSYRVQLIVGRVFRQFRVDRGDSQLYLNMSGAKPRNSFGD
jgi:hypothetical protein